MRGFDTDRRPCPKRQATAQTPPLAGFPAGLDGSPKPTKSVGAYSAASEAYSAASEAYSAASEAYSAASEAYSAASEAYSAASEAYSATPEAYSAAPDAYSAAPEAYSAAPEAYSAAPEAYSAAPEACSAAPEAYSAAPEACSAASGGYSHACPVACQGGRDPCRQLIGRQMVRQPANAAWQATGLGMVTRGIRATQQSGASRRIYGGRSGRVPDEAEERWRDFVGDGYW